MAVYYVEHEGKEWGPIEADAVGVELLNTKGSTGNKRVRLVFRKSDQVVAEYPAEYGYRLRPDQRPPDHE